MKKRTKKLLEGISSYISECYPFLNKNEQNEILENFIYRCMLNEINAEQIKDTARKMANAGFPEEEIIKYMMGAARVRAPETYAAGKDKSYYNGKFVPRSFFDADWANSNAYGDKIKKLGYPYVSSKVADEMRSNAITKRRNRRNAAYRSAINGMAKQIGIDKPEQYK